MTKDVWFLRIYAAICLVLAGALFTGAASAAHIAKPGPEPQILTIVNATGEDILSMGFQTGRSMHFVRFDMPPAGRDDIENPGAVAYLLWLTAMVFASRLFLRSGKTRALAAFLIADVSALLWLLL